MRYKDIAGQKFGRLTAVKRVGKDKHGHALWECECECGNKTLVPLNALHSGNTRSCGCLFIEVSKKGNHVTHGLSHTKTFRTWAGMKRRCNHPHCKDFPNYGGRGIRVCAEWVNDFQAFYDYVSILPHFNESGYTIDRINVDGNYEPGNIRWASIKEQANNKRNSKRKD